MRCSSFLHFPFQEMPCPLRPALPVLRAYCGCQPPRARALASAVVHAGCAHVRVLGFPDLTAPPNKRLPRFRSFSVPSALPSALHPPLSAASTSHAGTTHHPLHWTCGVGIFVFVTAAAVHRQGALLHRLGSLGWAGQPVLQMWGFLLMRFVWRTGCHMCARVCSTGGSASSWPVHPASRLPGGQHVRPPGNHLVRGMAALRSVYLKPGLVSTHQLMPPFALSSPLSHEHSIQSGQQFVT
jgi:hypothetical protein